MPTHHEPALVQSQRAQRPPTNGARTVRAWGLDRHYKTRKRKSGADCGTKGSCGNRDREKAEVWFDTSLLFTTEHGTPIEPRNFLRSWKARCTKPGVRYITVHDGRRSCD
jgi:integrase